MLPLTKEHWQAVSPYLEQAIDLPPDQRGAWLDQLRLTNSALAEDVQGLLAEHEELNSKGFLEQEPDRPTSPAAPCSLARDAAATRTRLASLYEATRRPDQAAALRTAAG